jgi:hypothetical protein
MSYGRRKRPAVLAYRLAQIVFLVIVQLERNTLNHVFCKTSF